MSNQDWRKKHKGACFCHRELTGGIYMIDWNHKTKNVETDFNYKKIFRFAHANLVLRRY